MRPSATRRRTTWWPIALVCCLVAAGCAAGRKTVATLSDVGPDQAILVGRIELDPPLKEGEQVLTGSFKGFARNSIIFVTDDHPRAFSGDLSPSDYMKSVVAPLRVTYYVAVPRKPIFFLRGLLYVTWISNRWEKAWFPGGYRVDIRPEDRAVYMGTVRYTRNEFMDVKKVEIIDDYSRDAAEFRKRFGSGVALQKRLATPVKDARAGSR
ncbi:MAG TPA: hypothetical protein VGV13_02265 [Methylomirabilota bacterium]|jgi:hypothetical protein|nr:hypothetical protein [Methylomirabilota bacterium]